MQTLITGQMFVSKLANSLAPPLSSICNTINSISNPTGYLLSSNLRKFHSSNFNCARVGGVEIPDDKRVEYSLQYIHGIGRQRAHHIRCGLNMVNKLTKDLSQRELIILRDEVSKYLTGGDLRRSNEQAIKRLVDIQCYRGIRHTQGLPCRGQRTKTNCRTLKGRPIAIAGKKKATR